MAQSPIYSFEVLSAYWSLFLYLLLYNSLFTFPLTFHYSEFLPIFLYLFLSPCTSQQEPTLLKAMRYLPIFLSGEYFISPFKYHFHTERGPVSRSGFTRTIYSETSLFQTGWQSVCTFQESF